MIRRVAKSATVSETEQSEGLASVTRSAMIMIIIMIMIMIIIRINHSYDNLRHHNDALEFPDYDIFILSSLTVNVLANPPWVEILTQEGPFYLFLYSYLYFHLYF